MSSPASDAAIAGFHATVLDGLPEAVIVATPDGGITFINGAAETLLGYGAAEVIGAPITMLVPQQPGRRADVVAWLARWAVEPDATAARYVDLIARRADGHEMPVEVRVRAGLVGDRERFFITVRDNSLRRAEATALKDANLRAAPSGNGKVVGKLQRHEVVQTVQNSGTWAKVRTESGKQGWVAKNLTWGW